jgi:hypothetical protein
LFTPYRQIRTKIDEKFLFIKIIHDVLLTAYGENVIIHTVQVGIMETFAKENAMLRK